VRSLRRRSLVTAIGGAAVLGSIAGAGPALAVSTPGQAVNNDYGQSPAEINAEVVAAVSSSGSVVTSKARYAAAHKILLVRIKSEAKAKAVYLAAVKSKKRTPIARTKKAYLGAHALTVKAKAADTATRTAYLKAVAATTTAVRAAHFIPVDGVYTGPAVQYFIPKLGLEPIQVQITVYGGHVSDVSVPQYVSTGDSASYNAMALPVLMQATMSAADTANVAVVSGASLTSGAYTKSLQAALTSAGFKG
jgi:uncharacterized protein with FMN-binding domain